MFAHKMKSQIKIYRFNKWSLLQLFIKHLLSLKKPKGDGVDDIIRFNSSCFINAGKRGRDLLG